MELQKVFECVNDNKFNEFQDFVSKHKENINDYYYGATLLFYSIECFKEKFALELLKYEETDIHLTNNVGLTCLEKALENKMYNIAELLIKRYSKDQLDHTLEYDGETLLTSSIKNFDETCTILLIEAGIDVNKPNRKKEYPIQLVIISNHLKVLEKMISTNNLNLNEFDAGFIPVLYACQNDLTDIAMLLINADADLDVFDEETEWTPLMHTITNHNDALTICLIDKECDVNMMNTDGNTALHLATDIENETIVRKLLSAHADKDTVNNDDMTAFDIAKANEDDTIMNLLK